MFPAKLVAVLVEDKADQWAEVIAEHDHAEPSEGRITIRESWTSTDQPDRNNEQPSAESAWRSLVGQSDRREYHVGDYFEYRLDDLQATYPDRIQVTPVRGTFTRPDPATVLRSDILTSLPTSPSDAVTAAELAERIGWGEWQVKPIVDEVPGVKMIVSTVTPDGRVRRGLYYLPPVEMNVTRPHRDQADELTPEQRAEMEVMLAEAG